MNPCDPSLAPVRCWEHDDCLEHPELALSCAAGCEAEWTVMELGFDLYEDPLDPEDTSPNRWRGRWREGDGWGDWPDIGCGAECGFSDGDGAGRGSGNSIMNGNGYGSEDWYSGTARCGWQL